MLTNKVFLKKTKRGSVIKIVREHYLRDDISCGSEICDHCDHGAKGPALSEDPENKSQIYKKPHYIIPDSNVVLHQVRLIYNVEIKIPQFWCSWKNLT